MTIIAMEAESSFIAIKNFFPLAFPAKVLVAKILRNFLLFLDIV